MRNRIQIESRLRQISAVALVLLAATSPGKAVDVSSSPSAREQKFEAWGTSLAWWANGVGGWSDQDAKSDLVRLMFDQANGLGLNYARYNVGGGQSRTLSGNFRPGALVQGWVPNAPSSIEDTSTWQWNTNADPRQREILSNAIDLGVDRIDAISYSAPYWMTISQDTAGGPNGGDNLLQTHYEEYAHYQTEVVKHFYENLGVRFQAFSPMNEADVNYWEAGGGQEGMRVQAGFDQRLLIEAVGQALQAKGLPVGISAGEELNASKTAASYNQFNSYTKSFITQLHTHVYGTGSGNSATALANVRNQASANGKRLYQSEYGNNSVTGLLGGIALAERITQDVNVMGVNGWAYWQVVEPTSLSGAGWGLAWAGYEQSDNEFVVRKQYHVMRQFSANIRPGSHILDTIDDDVVAAYDPATESTVLVMTNSSAANLNKSFTLLDGTPTFTRMIRTSDSEDYASLGAAGFTGNQISIDMPSPSVTTVVLHSRPNLIQNPHFSFAGESSPTGALSDGWQASGDAAFYNDVDHTGDGSGVASLRADAIGNSGAVRQTPIGDGASDLTGQAFQFSLDGLFQDDGASSYNANTHIALEFYGADGTTLAHSDEFDFATLIAPSFGDSQWRTFRTPIVVAPAGARYVTPVVRFDDVGSGSDSWVQLDDAYLQEVNYRPRGRQWLTDGNVTLTDDANWEFDASRPENTNLYFGPAITQARTIDLSEDFTAKSLTFDSTNTYRVVGIGRMTLDAEDGDALVDIRSGSQILQTDLLLDSDAVLQTLNGTSVNFSGDFDASGYRLRKQGPGTVTFSGGLQLAGGELELFATEQSTLTLGPASDLSGSLTVMLEPGVAPAEGQLFELVSYTATVVEFGSVVLPDLATGLDWELSYLESSLVASIVLEELPGDFNGDGFVDASDYTVWRDGLGDGYSETDYEIWRNSFGDSSAAAFVDSHSVPETNSAMLLALCILVTSRKKLIDAFAQSAMILQRQP